MCVYAVSLLLVNELVAFDVNMCIFLLTSSEFCSVIDTYQKKNFVLL
jgi:hypothetical protein